MSSRSRIARRSLILWAALLAVTATAVFATASAGAAGMTSHCDGAGEAPRRLAMYAMRDSLLCLVNRTREHYGLAPLELNPDLRISATHHSRDMVVHRYFDHAGSSGSTTEQRVARSGYLHRANGYRVGENIGGGVGRRYGSPIGVLREWMHSAPHRENLLDPRFRDCGIGVWRGFPGGGRGGAATYTLDLGARSG